MKKKLSLTKIDVKSFKTNTDEIKAGGLWSSAHYPCACPSLKCENKTKGCTSASQTVTVVIVNP